MQWGAPHYIPTIHYPPPPTATDVLICLSLPLPLPLPLSNLNSSALLRTLSPLPPSPSYILSGSAPLPTSELFCQSRRMDC